MEKLRINRFLSAAGYCSRREADRLIHEGRVLLNGKTAEPGSQVSAEDIVTVDNMQVCLSERHILLLFYKPRGIVSSTVSQRGEPNVVDYLSYSSRVYPVGRLDKESEGLLLMTNQGKLADQLLRAANYHEKEYEVDVDRLVTKPFLEKMAGGVPILNTVTRPCRIWKTGKKSFRIILTQGLNRQIRRMCEACGYHVVRLKRVRIVNLTLDGLEPGQYREASRKEWEGLLDALEGDRTVFHQ